MKATEFFLLVAAIYIAPTLSKPAGNIFALISIMAAAGFGIWGK